MAATWIELFIGAWVLVSPWLLGFANISFAKWSNVLLGLVLIVLAIWKLFGEPHHKGQS